MAFSVGGVVAWKAGLQGLKINNLVTVSSTRLRNETTTPDGKIKCYYGGLDKFRPKMNWFQQLKIDFKLFPNNNSSVIFFDN